MIKNTNRKIIKMLLFDIRDFLYESYKTITKGIQICIDAYHYMIIVISIIQILIFISVYIAYIATKYELSYIMDIKHYKYHELDIELVTMKLISITMILPFIYWSYNLYLLILIWINSAKMRVNKQEI